DVGRNVGRNVAGLGLDNRKGCHAAAALFVGEVGGALKQAGMQVKDITRIGLTAGRALKQQAQRAVGDGVLGKVVVDDQHVLAIVHKIFAQRAAGIGCDVLQGCG